MDPGDVGRRLWINFTEHIPRKLYWQATQNSCTAYEQELFAGDWTIKREKLHGKYLLQFFIFISAILRSRLYF